MSSKRGIFVAPFDELADPRLLAELAAATEERGFDGFFVWDHVNYRPPTRALADPWVALAAVACATRRVLIGPLVTPLPRRRVQKVARETATLDVLSDGRLVFGVGIGSENNGELEPFGEPIDRKERARLLDEGLERLVEFWDGDFEPRPVQRPRIPVWVAARWPNRAPVRRAVRWDGLFPIDMEDPQQLAELVAYAREQRGDRDGTFEVVVTNPAGTDPAPWGAAGATWCLTGFGATPREAEVREAIAAGP